MVRLFLLTCVNLLQCAAMCCNLLQFDLTLLHIAADVKASFTAATPSGRPALYFIRSNQDRI